VAQEVEQIVRNYEKGFGPCENQNAPGPRNALRCFLIFLEGGEIDGRVKGRDGGGGRKTPKEQRCSELVESYLFVVERRKGTVLRLQKKKQREGRRKKTSTRSHLAAERGKL